MGKNRKKRIFRAVLAALAAVSIFTGCGDKKENVIEIEKEKKQSFYSLTKAENQDVILTDLLVLKYTQKEQAEQYFKLSGYSVKEIYVSKGDMVKKGDLLGELNRSDLEEEIRQIKTTIAESNKAIELISERKALEYNQAERMIASGELKEEDYDAYINAIDEKYGKQTKEYEDLVAYQTLRLDYYNQQYEDGKLYASMDGMVSYARIYSASQLSSDSQKAVTLIDSDKCAFACDLIEYADVLTEGAHYTIRMAYDGKEYDTVYHLSDDGTQLLFEMVEPNYDLSIGAKAELRIVKDIAENVVAVENRAVHHAGELYYVYYVDENDIRRVEYVTVGLEGDTLTQITSGVNAGDILVTR